MKTTMSIITCSLLLVISSVAMLAGGNTESIHPVGDSSAVIVDTCPFDLQPNLERTM